jgi:putative glutamine amidotransferase
MSARQRPLIAVTTWRRSLSTSLGDHSELVTLAAEYCAALRAAGASPVLISDPDDDELCAIADLVDGVLLSGGGDIDPAHYGGPRDGGVDVDLRRDVGEFAMVAAARRRRLPLFGICRGLQLVNVACGGSLIPDLPVTSSHPRLCNAAEKLALRHQVSASTEWPLAGLSRDLEGRAATNSIHHQAVNCVGHGLRAVAWSADGVIEAIEGTEADWFLRAVQWHPERMSAPHERGHAPALLAEFVAAARSYEA